MSVLCAAVLGIWGAGAAVLDWKHPKLEFESTLSESFRRLPYPLRRLLRLLVALAWPLWTALAFCTAILVLAIDAWESSRR